MSYKSEGSYVWFEVPNHDRAVGRTTHYLFEVRVEAAGEYALLVAFEGSFKTRVC
jgi:hypothetical protein